MGCVCVQPRMEFGAECVPHPKKGHVQELLDGNSFWVVLQIFFLNPQRQSCHKSQNDRMEIVTKIFFFHVFTKGCIISLKFQAQKIKLHSPIY